MDLSLDALIVDDPITLSVKLKTGEQTWGSTVTVTNCQRNAPTREDLARGPHLLQKQAAVFHVWRYYTTGGFEPVIGSKLLDGTELYLVDRVEYMDRDASGSPQRWRLTCVRAPGAQTL